MRRPRCRLIARWLERLAHRIYPEPLYTLQVMAANKTTTFIDCREYREYREEPPRVVYPGTSGLTRWWIP